MDYLTLLSILTWRDINNATNSTSSSKNQALYSPFSPVTIPNVTSNTVTVSAKELIASPLAMMKPPTIPQLRHPNFPIK